MQVEVYSREIWPVFSISAEPREQSAVEVPDALVRDWWTAQKELRKAEDRILLHLKSTAQPIPGAFDRRKIGERA